jgi:hypothetical protein
LAPFLVTCIHRKGAVLVITMQEKENKHEWRGPLCTPAI